MDRNNVHSLSQRWLYFTESSSFDGSPCSLGVFYSTFSELSRHSQFRQDGLGLERKFEAKNVICAGHHNFIGIMHCGYMAFVKGWKFFRFHMSQAQFYSTLAKGAEFARTVTNLSTFVRSTVTQSTETFGSITLIRPVIVSINNFTRVTLLGFSNGSQKISKIRQLVAWN